MPPNTKMAIFWLKIKSFLILDRKMIFSSGFLHWNLTIWTLGHRNSPKTISWGHFFIQNFWIKLWLQVFGPILNLVYILRLRDLSCIDTYIVNLQFNLRRVTFSYGHMICNIVYWGGLHGRLQNNIILVSFVD